MYCLPYLDLILFCFLASPEDTGSFRPSPSHLKRGTGFKTKWTDQGSYTASMLCTGIIVHKSYQKHINWLYSPENYIFVNRYNIPRSHVSFSNCFLSLSVPPKSLACLNIEKKYTCYCKIQWGFVSLKQYILNEYPNVKSEAIAKARTSIGLSNSSSKA